MVGNNEMNRKMNPSDSENTTLMPGAAKLAAGLPISPSKHLTIIDRTAPGLYARISSQKTSDSDASDSDGADSVAVSRNASDGADSVAVSRNASDTMRKN